MNIANEICRKSLHFLLIFFPIFYCFFGKWKAMMIIAPIATVIISIDYLRKSNPKLQEIFVKIFGSVLRPHEIENKGKLSGASSVMFAACINFLLFSPEIAVISFSILVVSDGLAAIVGKAIPSQPFFEKSRAGALTFFISALIILVVCGLHFQVRWWFYLFGIFSVVCVTLIESRPSLIDVDDNISIPLTFSLLMTGFVFMWG